MDAKSVEPFSLETTWPLQRCNTVQEYLQGSYGTLDQTGCEHAFRGVSRRFSNLWPSIDRREIAGVKPVEIETHLLEGFLRQVWDHLTEQERHRCLLAEARWGTGRNTGTLVVARHRLVPTRCIDWSSSPLVSLFFAGKGNPENDGEVWWFNRIEFDRCVAAQWPAVYGKQGHVTAEIERDFIAGRSKLWFTALHYMLIADDRLERQKGWITVAGRFETCHAQQIHRLGVREKGRLVIPAELKPEAIRLLAQLGITDESLGLCHSDRADEIATQIKEKFEKDFPLKTRATPSERDA